jgi:hypothetical protein
VTLLPVQLALLLFTNVIIGGTIPMVRHAMLVSVFIIPYHIHIAPNQARKVVSLKMMKTSKLSINQ